MTDLSRIIITICLAVVSGYSLANEEKSDFGTSVGYNVRGSMFFTSDDDDGEQGVGNVLDYKPELIPTQAVKANLMWKGSSFYSLLYETPLGGTADQTESIEIANKDAAIKKINTYLDLFFIGGGEYNLLNKLRFDYKYHVFLGNAETQEANTTYVSSDGQTLLLSPGDEIRFKSEFTETSLTIPFSHSKSRRWGIYHSVTNKPHETTLSGNVVLETEITGIGVKLLNTTKTYTSEINIGTVQFRAPQRNFSADGFDFVYHGEWRFSNHGKMSLALIPLIGFQFNFQLAGSPDNADPGDQTGELSMDIIVDAGLRFEMLF